MEVVSIAGFDQDVFADVVRLLEASDELLAWDAVASRVAEVGWDVYNSDSRFEIYEPT